MKQMVVYLVVLMSTLVLVTGFAKESSSKSVSAKDKVVIRLANKDEIGMNVECVTHGADLKIEKDTKVAEYHSTNFYFCTVGEDVKFQKDPEAYLAATLTNSDQEMAGMSEDKDKKTDKKSEKKSDKKSERKSDKKEMDM